MLSAHNNVTPAELLKAYGYYSHRKSSPQEVENFAKELCAAWRSKGDTDAPEPNAVLDRKEKFYPALERAWMNYLSGEYPRVEIASVLVSANPFFVHGHGNSSLTVMAIGLWRFVFGTVLTARLYAHEKHDPKECLAAMQKYMYAWLDNSPESEPSWGMLYELVTNNWEDAELAWGFANSIFTWAFYHELGHFRLGHIGISHAIGSIPNGKIEVYSYEHKQEFEADHFGMGCFLDLLDHEMELRKDFPIGRDIDHAPIIGFKLMDMAYRLYPKYDHRISESHPSPRARAAALFKQVSPRLSRKGKENYDYWRALLIHVEDGLKIQRGKHQNT